MNSDPVFLNTSFVAWKVRLFNIDPVRNTYEGERKIMQSHSERFNAFRFVPSSFHFSERRKKSKKWIKILLDNFKFKFADFIFLRFFQTFQIASINSSFQRKTFFSKLFTTWNPKCFHRSKLNGKQPPHTNIYLEYCDVFYVFQPP
jgi:hypothetical protein